MKRPDLEAAQWDATDAGLIARVRHDAAGEMAGQGNLRPEDAVETTDRLEAVLKERDDIGRRWAEACAETVEALKGREEYKIALEKRTGERNTLAAAIREVLNIGEQEAGLGWREIYQVLTAPTIIALTTDCARLAKEGGA